MSPVAAVIIIVSASVKVNPLVLVKRTWVPLMSGVWSFWRFRSSNTCEKSTVQAGNCLH